MILKLCSCSLISETGHAGRSCLAVHLKGFFLLKFSFGLLVFKMISEEEYFWFMVYWNNEIHRKKLK